MRTDEKIKTNSTASREVGPFFFTRKIKYFLLLIFKFTAIVSVFIKVHAV